MGTVTAQYFRVFYVGMVFRLSDYQSGLYFVSPSSEKIQQYLCYSPKMDIVQFLRHILLVHWQTLADHTVGFRGSEQYAQWKVLLHHFYDPFPTVQHYALVTNGIK